MTDTGKTSLVSRQGLAIHECIRMSFFSFRPGLKAFSLQITS